MYEVQNLDTLNCHSANDVLMSVSECILCHIQDMQLFRFYSVATSQLGKKELENKW